VREATVVRLHVINLRSRRLSKVRARLLEVRSADGSLSHPESDWLRWMHDDGSSHSASIDDRQVEPGNDESAYLDLATKVHRSPAFVLELRWRTCARPPMGLSPLHFVGGQRPG
jgi:hypothetical protein